MKPSSRFWFFFVVVSMVLSLSLVGCQLFGPGSDAEDLASVIADIPPTTGSANVALNVVIPDAKVPVGTIRSALRGAGQAYVTLRLIVVNAGDQKNPTTILTKTVPVDETGKAETFFSGVPERTTVCQVKIEGGSLGGKTDFHGASDLKSGNNEVTVTPVGCGDSNDVLAQVVVSVVANPELVVAAPANLAAKVREATEFILSGGATGPSAYQDAFDRTMTNKTFTNFVFTPISVSFDGGIKQDIENGWTLTSAKLWEGVGGAEGLRALRVLRQGLGATKPPMITFSDIAKQRFAIATIDPQTGKIQSYILSDGSSLRNLSAAIIMPEDQSVVFGGTANGLPVLIHWSATQTSEIGFPPAGSEIKKYFAFPGLASSTSFAQPSVEYLDADAVEKGVINVVVRDPSTLMLKEYRILADGTVVPRQPLPVDDAPAPIWPLVAMSASGSVTLNWDQVPNAESYNLYYSFDAEVGSGSKKIENVKNSYTVTGLQNGLTYYFKMTWLIGGQEYGPSRIVAASPKEPAVTAPTAPVAPADVKGVWLCQQTDAQGVEMAGEAPMEVVIRQNAGSSVFTMDPEVWVDEGQTWLQTINDGRVTGNKLSWADLRVASGSMGYRTLWSATVNGNSMTGEGSDIMGSSFGGHLTPGDEKGVAYNDRWWFVATRTSSIVPEVPAPTVIYYDATLGGAWLVKHNGIGINSFIFDGRGNIIDHGDGFWQAGTYKVNQDGSFALTSGMDDYGTPMTLKHDGKLTGYNGGTIGPEGFPASYTLERVTNVSAAQGIWSGQLAVSSIIVGNSVPATYTTDLTFIVGPDGRLTSIMGSKITGFKNGNFLIGSNGAAHGAFRTNTSVTTAPWTYFSVDGIVTGDEFKGMIEIPIGDGNYRAPVVLRRQAPGSRIPTMNDLAGTWEVMRSIQPDGKIVEFLPSPSGKRIAYTVALDGKASLQGYETQQIAAGMQILDTPVLPPTSSIW
ncbi:MAG: fibronectin type III domain-containing protein, partial [Candidatus Riflebacteria bacterium]|nr:fibronectin type III domain-containing protein [Candidatus Riflebacteria bacterium]